MILRMVLVVSAIAVGVTAAAAQQEAVKVRKDVMGGISKPWYGVLARIQRGQAPYDQAAVDAAMEALAAESQKIAAAFTPNVMPASRSDYDSSPKIWESKADFDAKTASFVKTVADNRGAAKDIDSLKAAVSKINDTCSACHQVYRVRNR